MKILAPFLLAVQVVAADVTLVENNRTEHVIYHAVDAPETAKLAAKELQRVIQRATGSELSITNDAAAAPAIRIVSSSHLPHDGFEIRCEGKNIIIAGNDDLTATKLDAWFVPGHGTLYGAQDYLERFVGVRWLFPGELGEDVPHLDVLRVALPEPVRGAPDFAVRSLAYVGESDKGTPQQPKSVVLDWMKRQRLTNALHSFVTGYGHSWDDYLTPADMEAHPEWKSSNGEAVRNGKVKFFCTTAPGLVETFTKRVIEILDRYPTREMASISPTDGGGFCQCERCAKLITTDPHGKPNHVLAILTFYQQVAGIIQRERPGRRLGGFVYYNYQYPPPEAPTLPDNLSLCWAPLNYYGYGLLKPLYRAEFTATMDRWSKITPHLFYHNYSTWMRSFHGAPLPVSLDILQRELPAAAKHHAWGARMVGSAAWGVNAPINYIIAKQMWNAQLDVSATLDEWLQRAYGPGWQHMRTLYDELDAKMLAHKEAQSPVYKGSQYEVNEDVMKSIYAPLFPALEQHYQQTLAQCATDTQRQRLAMFGHNLTQLHFALRKAKLIPDDAKSIFHRDDTAFAKFLKDMESTFSLYRDDHGIDHGPIWKGEWSAP
ncbi:DUF4838 domain-containing protein [Prosthecobacter sp.]|uniref:DUF4838 domain-containing protein n=1 Tax=Prosthecobacter sp. TaxID=1965333 RepID=UPI002ABC1AD3|nr:DUF4838 domain-containing protein [Prosthecobacter sp.]MDZ4406022.1 DUF4838 domain-containing protein [Prosthecobacter sp.]